MLHFSCDLCGQQLEDQRFVVKLEVFAAFDPDQIEEQDLDEDNLQEVAKIIQEMETTGESDIDDCGTKKYRFDLCERCQTRFTRDPLGRNALGRMNFSEN